MIKETEGKRLSYVHDLMPVLLDSQTFNPYNAAIDAIVRRIILRDHSAESAACKIVALEAISEVLRNTQEREKYPPNSWKEVEPALYIDAFMRHISQPHSIDPETHFPHVNHALCNLAFLAWFYSQGDI